MKECLEPRYGPSTSSLKKKNKRHKGLFFFPMNPYVFALLMTFMVVAVFVYRERKLKQCEDRCPRQR